MASTLTLASAPENATAADETRDVQQTTCCVVGAGIKYAIEDAVVAANVLAEPLKAGQVRLHYLGEVQRHRQWPTWFIQAAGSLIGTQFLRRLLRASGAVHIPRLVFFLFRLPLVSWLIPRLLGIGLWRVHVKS